MRRFEVRGIAELCGVFNFAQTNYGEIWDVLIFMATLTSDVGGVLMFLANFAAKQLQFFLQTLGKLGLCKKLGKNGKTRIAGQPEYGILNFNLLNNIIYDHVL